MTRRRPIQDVRVVDPSTGASIDYETRAIIRSDPTDWSTPLRALALIRRKFGEAVTAHDLWKLIGRKNPARQEGSRAGGEATALKLSRAERQERARAGGVAVFHGPDGYDQGRATTYGKRMKRLQIEAQTGKRQPKKPRPR